MSQCRLAKPVEKLSTKFAEKDRSYDDIVEGVRQGLMLLLVNEFGFKRPVAETFLTLQESMIRTIIAQELAEGSKHAEFAESRLAIGKQAKEFFKAAMQEHLSCFKANGLSCNVAEGQKIDDVKGCEVAVIGNNFTWHTHMCTIQPSEVDFATTKKLGKRFLCIGLSSTGKNVCYDLADGNKRIDLE